MRVKEHYGCDFCNDLRNIEPASYIGGGNEEFQKWITEQRENKRFLLEAVHGHFMPINFCPMCGYKFTEEDYDDYD